MESFLTIFLGAILAQVFYRNKFIGDHIVNYVKKYHPNTDEQSVIKFENFIVPIFGTIIAYKLNSPDSWMEQIIAGFGWCAVFESIIKKSKDD